MAVDVSTEIVIERPRDRVAEYAADPSNAPEWYDNITSVEWVTEQPLALGTQTDFVARFLGRRLAYTYEVVEYQPREKLVMRTAQGPFPMETTYTWIDIGDDRTRMILRNRGAPKGFSKVVAPFVSSAVRRANRKDLDSLKSIVESHT
jgi:uncharacterized membrane protein